jgi:hypothetical protein
MQYNSGRGSLFKNDRKLSDQDPDYKGEANIGGTTHWVSAWIKVAKNGSKYMSLSIRPKDEPKPERTYATRRDDIDMLS